MDMLVKLYEIDPHETLLKVSEVERKNNVAIRRAMAYEKEVVIEFVRGAFSETWYGWPSECDKAFSNWPISCFLATWRVSKEEIGDETAGSKVVGFACYDVTCRGFFGPSGVAKSFRRRGIGSCLLLSSLCAMRQEAYGYAIVGGPEKKEQWDFYKKTAGAIMISGSENGVYHDMLDGIKH